MAEHLVFTLALARRTAHGFFNACHPYRAFGVSGDGGIIVGVSVSPAMRPGAGERAFEWTRTPSTNTGRMTRLPLGVAGTGAPGSNAHGVSDLGTLIEGYVRLAGGETRAVAWHRTGVITLPTTSSVGRYSTNQAKAVSGDGISRIVGSGYFGSTNLESV